MKLKTTGLDPLLTGKLYQIILRVLWVKQKHQLDCGTTYHAVTIWVKVDFLA